MEASKRHSIRRWAKIPDISETQSSINQTNVRLHEDLLKHLGPRWCVYLGRPAASRRLHSKREKFRPVGLGLAGRREGRHGLPQGPRHNGRAVQWRPGRRRFRTGRSREAGRQGKARGVPRQAADARRWDIVWRRRSAGRRWGSATEVRPTILVGKSYIAVAATPDLAREGAGWEGTRDRRPLETDAPNWHKPPRGLAQRPELFWPSPIMATRELGGMDRRATLASPSLLLNMSEEDDLNNASARLFSWT